MHIYVHTCWHVHYTHTHLYTNKMLKGWKNGHPTYMHSGPLKHICGCTGASGTGWAFPALGLSAWADLPVKEWWPGETECLATDHVTLWRELHPESRNPGSQPLSFPSTRFPSLLTHLLAGGGGVIPTHVHSYLWHWWFWEKLSCLCEESKILSTPWITTLSICSFGKWCLSEGWHLDTILPLGFLLCLGYWANLLVLRLNIKRQAGCQGPKRSKSLKWFWTCLK